MDSEHVQRWQTADRLFGEWLECAPVDRANWLASQAIDDATRVALDRLIAQQARDDLPPDALAGVDLRIPSPTSTTNALRGRSVGQWKLIEEIGRGGMSVVYKAQRVDVDFEQVAAVKLLSLAALGSEGSERFEQERRVLARLHHPHIAALIDGGVAEDGTPYLVMPLVSGRDLATYCEVRQLGWQKRVALLVEICAAVAHAHQNLLVHRDLKPGNILVSDEGVPTLLDFGIAKLLDVEEGATHTGFRVMTPGFAAPEQISGATITTATDVYALGVILRTLCAELHPLPRDLDNIIAMATRPEAARRYPDARALGEDLKRLLSGHVVQATPDSAGYRLRSFLHRRRGWVAAAAMVFLALVGGLAATLWQARKAELQALEAVRQSVRAEAAREFLFDLFEAGNRDQTDGDDPRVSSLVERGAQQLQQFVDQPELHAEMSILLARIDTVIGQHERAGRLLDGARTSAERSGESVVLSAVDSGQGNLANALGESERAVLLFERALERLEQADEADPAARTDMLSGWVYAMHNLGRQEEASTRIASELELPGNHYSAELRGQLLLSQSSVAADPEQKLQLVVEAARQFALQPVSSARQMELDIMLGDALARVGRHDESMEHLRQAVEHADRLYPGETRRRARTYNDLGSASRAAGSLAEANAAYAVAESIYRALGDDHTPAFAALVHNRGVLLRDIGDSARGLPLLEHALALASDQFGENDRRTGLALRHVAMLRAEAAADPRADQEWLRARQASWSAASARVKFDLLLIGIQIALDLERNQLAGERLAEADALMVSENLELSEMQQIRRNTLLGTLRSIRGDNAGAEMSLQQALDLASTTDGSARHQQWRIEQALAQHAERKGDLRTARLRLGRALDALLALEADSSAISVVAIRKHIAELEASPNS